MEDNKKPYVHPISPSLREVMEGLSDDANDVLIRILNEVGGQIVEKQKRTLNNNQPSDAEDALQHSQEVTTWSKS